MGAGGRVPHLRPPPADAFRLPQPAPAVPLKTEHLPCSRRMMSHDPTRPPSRAGSSTRTGSTFTPPGRLRFKPAKAPAQIEASFVCAAARASIPPEARVPHSPQILPAQTPPPSRNSAGANRSQTARSVPRVNSGAVRFFPHFPTFSPSHFRTQIRARMQEDARMPHRPRSLLLLLNPRSAYNDASVSGRLSLPLDSGLLPVLTR
jgi:hypothetical protein